MNSTSLDEVMDNIYGAGATQLMGGAKAVAKTSDKNKKDKFEYVAFPEYVTNSDFQLFVQSFYLMKRIVNSYPSTIYLIPPKEDIEKMIKDFKAELEKKKIDYKSNEAAKYAAINSLPYKSCIFNVYGDADKNEYKIMADENGIKEFKQVKRTNLRSEQYFFKYKSKNEIYICNSESDKGSVVAKLLAVTEVGVLVFQGKLPKATKFIEHKFIIDGGAKEDYTLAKFKKLKTYIGNKPNDKMLQKFIAEIYSGNVVRDKNLCKEFCSLACGDLMHFCFKICYNNKIKPLFSKCDTKEVNKIMKDIIKGYCPGKSTFTKAKIRDSLNKTYAKSLVGGLSPLDSTINYLSDLKNIYKNNEKIYSDIALSLYKTGQYDDIEDIYDYTADVKELYDDVIDQPDEIIDSEDETDEVEDDLEEVDEVEEEVNSEDDLEDAEELEDETDEVEETEDTSGLTGGAKKKCKGKKCSDKKKTTKTKKDKTKKKTTKTKKVKKDKTKKKTTKKAKAKKAKKSKAGKKYNALHMEVGKNGVVYTTSKLNHEIKSLFDKSPLLSYETSLYYPIIEEDEEEIEIIEQPKIEEPVKKEPEDVIELSDGNIVDKAEEDEEETII